MTDQKSRAEALDASIPDENPESEPELLELRSFKEVESRPTEWLLKGKLPLGEHILVVGHGGLGKSTYTLQLGADVTNGILDGEHEGTPKDVIVFTTEDSLESTVKPRLQAAGANLAKVLFVPMDAEDNSESKLVKLKEQIPALDRTLTENTGIDVGLIVFDPLVSFMSGAELHKEAEVRDILNPLGVLARKHDLTIASIMHFNKGSGASTYTRVANSAAFRNAVRVLLVWGQPDGFGENDRALVYDKFNVGVKPQAETWEIRTKRVRFDKANRRGDVTHSDMSYVVQTGTSNIHASELVAPTAAADAPKRRAAIDLIESVMDGADWVWSVALIEAAEQDGVNPKGSTFQDAKRELGLDTAKVGHQGGWVTFNPKRITRDDVKVVAERSAKEEASDE